MRSAWLWLVIIVLAGSGGFLWWQHSHAQGPLPDFTPPPSADVLEKTLTPATSASTSANTATTTGDLIQ